MRSPRSDGCAAILSYGASFGRRRHTAPAYSRASESLAKGIYCTRTLGLSPLLLLEFRQLLELRSNLL